MADSLSAKLARFMPMMTSPQLSWVRIAMSDSFTAPDFNAAAWYRMLEAYYLSNGLYEQMSETLYNTAVWNPAMKPLRNPAYRVVELYVSKLWPGPLPDALQIKYPDGVDRPELTATIHKIWEDSDWNAQKQVFARWLPLFGDGFLKVATNAEDIEILGSLLSNEIQPEKVIIQNIKPEYVTELDENDASEVTFIRIDIPRQRRDLKGEVQTYYFTEVWDLSNDLMRTWETQQGPQNGIEQLGAPKTKAAISSFGISFIPIVHTKFRDIGQVRGLSVFATCLDKIDEANRMATRLHQMLFRYNKPLLVVSARDRDPAGRPLPAPKIDGKPLGEDVEVRDDEIFYMPGMSQMEQLVPKVDYDSALRILQDHMTEIEHDMPELAYYKLREIGRDLSGRAVRLLLADAFDKIVEARAIAEKALAKVDQMAILIGQNMGIFQPGLGDYYEGGLKHSFLARDVITVSELEKAETMRTGKQAGVPVGTMARRVGWTQAEIDQMYGDKQKEDAYNLTVTAAEEEITAQNEPIPTGEDIRKEKNTSSGEVVQK